MHKESFIINHNTLLHVSTLLGHLQGEHIKFVNAKQAEDIHHYKNIKKKLKKVLPEDDPAGSKHVGVCYD
jgi:hypothetical protein